MNIFLVLLKKEIKELLTKQLVLTIAATLLVFHVIGKAVGSHNKASAARNTIVLLDLDRTPLSARVAKAVAAAKTALKPAPETDIKAALAAPEHAAENSFMLIPAGLEAEVGIVDAGERLGEVVVGDDGDHRAEGLQAHDLHVFCYAHEHRRQVDPPFGPAARGNRCPLGDGFFYPGVDSLPLPRVDHRTHIAVAVERVADFQGCDLVEEDFGELLNHPLIHVNPLQRDADLA